VSEEQIEAIKVESRKNMTDALDNLQKKMDVEKTEAVERAVKRETANYNLKLEEQKSLYENKIADLHENWLIKLKHSQMELRNKLTKEAEKQFTLNGEQWKCEKSLEIDGIKGVYEKELDTLRSDYNSKKNDLNQMRRRLDLVVFENDQLKSMVQELRMELKNVIEHFSTRTTPAENKNIYELKSILKNPKIIQKTTFKL